MNLFRVASFAEAWIEIRIDNDLPIVNQAVASFAEAWIEIKGAKAAGQKSGKVASFAEAWIEICRHRCYL